jgi:hypothetical protein
VIDDRGLAGELVGLVEVLGREHDVGAAGDERPDRLPEFVPASRVEPRRGLVEQEESGCADQTRAEIESATQARRNRS